MRTSVALAAATALGAIALVGVAPSASAAVTKDLPCSNGSFNGTVRMYINNTTGYQGTVTQVSYRLGAADSSSNKNNVAFNDGGTAPTTGASTSSGIRDNAFHSLRSADYARGYGGVSIKLTFDRSGTDPSCTASDRF